MSDQLPLPRDEAEALFARLSRRARRRRRARMAGRLAVVAGAVAILGGGLLYALGGLRDLGPDRRPGASPVEGCGTPSTTVSLAVLETGGGGRRFDRSCLAVPPEVPFVVTFRNDARGSASFSIYAQPPTCVREMQGGGVGAVSCSPPPLFDGDPVNGPDSIRYTVEGLPAGTYHFQSDLQFEDLHGKLEVTN